MPTSKSKLLHSTQPYLLNFFKRKTFPKKVLRAQIIWKEIRKLKINLKFINLLKDYLKSWERKVCNNLRSFFSFDFNPFLSRFFLDCLAKLNPLHFLTTYIIRLAALDTVQRLDNFTLPSKHTHKHKHTYAKAPKFCCVNPVMTSFGTWSHKMAHVFADIIF